MGKMGLYLFSQVIITDTNYGCASLNILGYHYTTSTRFEPMWLQPAVPRRTMGLLVSTILVITTLQGRDSNPRVRLRLLAEFATNPCLNLFESGALETIQLDTLAFNFLPNLSLWGLPELITVTLFRSLLCLKRPESINGSHFNEFLSRVSFSLKFYLPRRQ